MLKNVSAAEAQPLESQEGARCPPAKNLTPTFGFQPRLSAFWSLRSSKFVLRPVQNNVTEMN